MIFVITRLCRDCVDGACVEACPVDCIVEHAPRAGSSDLPNQLFIDPSQCIGCSKCEPVCPWQAIYEEDYVPSAFQDDIALNAIAAAQPHEFVVPAARLTRQVSTEEVLANRLKWQRPAAPDDPPGR